MGACKFIFTLVAVYSVTVCVQTGSKSSKTVQEDGVDKLWQNVMRTVPLKRTNSLVPRLLGRHFNDENVAYNEGKTTLTPAPLQEKLASKKSTEALPMEENSAVLDIALMNSGVYLNNERKDNELESTRPGEFAANKRFNIPRSQLTHGRSQASTTIRLPPESYFQKSKRTTFSDNKPPSEYIPVLSEDTSVPFADSPISSENTSMAFKNPASFDNTVTLADDRKTASNRIKRQLDDIIDAESPTADSVTNDNQQTDSVHHFSTLAPANNVEDQELDVRSGIHGINTNKAMAVIPLRMETPTVISEAAPSLVLTSVDSIKSLVPGTERSTLPVTRLVQALPSSVVKTEDSLTRSQIGNVVLKLPGPSNDAPTLGRQHNELRTVTQPEKDEPVIKLAQVPVNILTSDSISDGKKKTITEPGRSDEINVNALKSLQSRLTDIISKLEGNVDKKDGRKNKKVSKKKAKALNETFTNKGPSEKSLKFLKQRLSRVLAKFKKKPVAGQSFTIGKEWSHLLDSKTINQENPPQSGEASSKSSLQGLRSQNEDVQQGNEGNWPSIASQLLRKLNKALIKLQERRVVHALGKNAVMYFNFDKAKSSNNNEDLVVDKSGHFNDATLSDRARISSRTYGSCGNALVLNSGNLRYVDKYFKNKPAKAITLAMWVRTNATGYVRWFARDTSSSREFSAHTQYPLVRKNVWTHLCGTYNSSTGITRIYVDGELKAEKVDKHEDTIPADFTPAGIGSKFGDTNLIAVDEVYMFSRALSEKEVHDLYDDCEFNRMVLHYGFQKINRTSGVVFDQSGLNNNAELKGDASILDSGCEKCGSCLALNSKEDPRLTLQGSRFNHRPTKAISLAAWFNLNSTTGTHPLFEVTNTFTKAPLLDLRVTDGKLHWKGNDKNQKTIFDLKTEQSVIPEGIWVHILVTFDSVKGSAKIFVDGHQKALANTMKKRPIGEDWGETRIGGNSIGSQALGGYIDELVMYNWELDPSEISYVMKYCPDHPKLVSFTVHIPLE